MGTMTTMGVPKEQPENEASLVTSSQKDESENDLPQSGAKWRENGEQAEALGSKK